MEARETVSPLLLSSDFSRSGVENLRFSSIFIIVFYSIAVSSLIVRLYDYRSSADDFCSKSVRPGLSYVRLHRIKNEWRCCNLASPLILSYNLNDIRVENLRFSSIFIIVFYSVMPKYGSPRVCSH